MSISFACPSCKARYDVTDELAGKSILCRVCKKRGTVPAAPAKAAEPTKPAAEPAKSTVPAKPATPPNPGRRRFILMAVGGLGAIITGAVLARRPWKHWGDPPPSPDDPARRRGPGGRGKGGGPGGDPKGPPGPPPDRAQKKARGGRGGAPRAGRAGV